MKQTESESRYIRKNRGIPREERPRCGARTRKGTPCQAQALLNRNGLPGRCKLHGGMSTGPKTATGKVASREASRTSMIQRWRRMKDDGIIRMPLTEAGRERLRQSSRRNMRMRHRRQQALRWADWLMEQHRDHTTRLFFTRTRNIILQPFRNAIEHGGYEELIELASFTGLKLEDVPDGTELYGVILGRYRCNIKRLVDEFRAGAG
jgi:hypothetical protein